MRWYVIALRNHLDSNFYGRASRTEFWMFYLVNAVIVGVLAVTIRVLILLRHAAQSHQGAAAAQPAFSALHVAVAVLVLYVVVMIFPSLTVAVRRLHDTGRPGPYLLFCYIPFGFIWLLTFFAEKGQAGDNQYGPDPRSAVSGGPATRKPAGSS
ncbi:MAG TPA: DUF805 domain-containing protein [Actinobacteria bacterium]|nr:DUF805 domain-containing protein [Actinomycetota bacterium]